MKKLRWMLAGALCTLVLVAGGSAAAIHAFGPRSLGDFFFGPHLARAEIVLVQNQAVQDWRVDRGRVRSVSRSSIELKELDGTVMSIPLAPSTQVEVNGQSAPFNALRRGLTVLAMRLQDQPAQRIEILFGRR